MYFLFKKSGLFIKPLLVYRIIPYSALADFEMISFSIFAGTCS